MRRKKVYLMVGVGIFSIIVGNRFYQKSLVEGSGYLGDEVVFFAEVASPDAEPEDENGAPRDVVWGDEEEETDSKVADAIEKKQEIANGAQEAGMTNAQGLPISSAITTNKKRIICLSLSIRFLSYSVYKKREAKTSHLPSFF